MNCSPIILFAYNRLESMKATVNSVLGNKEASESDLFVYVDGAIPGDEADVRKVKKVQAFVKSISGFKSVSFKFAERNRGLGASVIAGVTEIINRYGTAIVLEDDLILTPNCLSFINQGLERYCSDKEVFSICGYSNHVKRPSGYVTDSYFCTRSSSWGWGTWADRWNSVDWELEPFEQFLCRRKAFNKWGGSDCFSMLKAWHEGKNGSWAIRFCFAQFLQDKLSLFPFESKITNKGFDGQGTNCKQWSRFKCDVDTSGKKVFVWPSNDELDSKLFKKAMKYHSVPFRLFSRIMYLIDR